MTFVGGFLHTLPFLIPSLQVALYAATQPGIHRRSGQLLRALAGAAASDPELQSLWSEIATIRYRFFKMPFAKSILQVVIGGALVFLAGVLIGGG